jgi:hypothetical protein
MGHIERQLAEAALCLFDAGATFVTEDQLLAAMIPPDEPQRRLQNSYAYAVERMNRRGLLDSYWSNGKVVGFCLGRKAYKELGREPPVTP